MYLEFSFPKRFLTDAPWHFQQTKGKPLSWLFEQPKWPVINPCRWRSSQVVCNALSLLWNFRYIFTFLVSFWVFSRVYNNFFFNGLSFSLGVGRIIRLMSMVMAFCQQWLWNKGCFSGMGVEIGKSSVSLEKWCQRWKCFLGKGDNHGWPVGVPFQERCVLGLLQMGNTDERNAVVFFT